MRSVRPLKCVAGADICHLEATTLLLAPPYETDLQSGIPQIHLYLTHLNGRLTKLEVLLQQYNIEYVPQKAIKGLSNCQQFGHSARSSKINKMRSLTPTMQHRVRAPKGDKESSNCQLSGCSTCP